MKIVVSKKIYASHADETTTKQYASDATIRDVRDDMLTCTSLPSGISVWDCTLHPPKNITNWLFEEFPEKMGPKSKTLFDAGCFPSAVWQVLPEGDAPATRSVMEDHQYNQTSISSTVFSPTFAASKVELVDQPKGGLKPSEVLHQVTQRFEGDDDNSSDAARVARRKQKQERRAKEMARHSKLEARIKKLGAIKSGTSEQVRKMLLKSRCTGAKSLKMPDRVYLQVAHFKGEAVTEDFRYFSRQDTVARVVQNLSDAKPPQEAELLVPSSSQTYRRLPLTLRLHEGIEKGWLQDADTVIVRYFTPPEQEATTSILEEDTTEAEDVVMAEAVKELKDSEPPVVLQSNEISPASPATVATKLSRELTARFASAIATIDKKSKAKKSSSAQRVRQMMMKSKSKGDAKRTPKMEDRFFVEVILLEGSDSSAPTSDFVFMAKTDSLDRLLKEHIKADRIAYAIKGENEFFELSTGSTLQELEDANMLYCFDRIVVDKL
jgi:hypothetical protein